ncbi:MAG: HupE/UreJ family protein, partial [Verrucomicrobiae bacterium]|nr:HupE/UreJ family protein [Verrucomicrobiae bacterium]
MRIPSFLEGRPPASSRAARVPGRQAGLLGCLLILHSVLPLCSLFGHSTSTAFLRIERDREIISGQLEIPLRDLDDLLGLDSNDDGRLSWGELRLHESELNQYAASRLGVREGRAPRPLELGELQVSQRQEEAYAVFNFSASSDPSDGPLFLSYQILFDHDPLHRCLISDLRSGFTAIVTADRREIPLPGAASASSGPSGFLREGIHHILSGYDHLMFLLALLLPSVLRRTPAGWTPAPGFREVLTEVLQVVTAFTIAHSLTLAGATLGWVRLPSRLVESTIAGSILLAAGANLISFVDCSLWERRHLCRRD